MADQIVPLTPAPNQQLFVSLSVDGAPLTLQLTIRFSEIAGYWLMSISDRAGNLLADSLPMLTGDWPASNLLAQHRYLKIGSAYMVNASGIAEANPDATNLGTDFVLVWSDTPTL